MTHDEFVSACKAVTAFEAGRLPKAAEAIVTLGQVVANAKDVETAPFLAWLRALPPTGPYLGPIQQLQARIPARPAAPRPAPSQRTSVQEESAR